MSRKFFAILLFLFVIFVIAHSAKPYQTDAGEQNSKWSYSGKTGPEYWGNLDPSYRSCAKGLQQSPINIDKNEVIENSTLLDIQFHYFSTGFVAPDTKYTIELTPEMKQNYIKIGEEKYLLKQIHFHQPSEHQIDLKKFPLEIHFVHQNLNGEIAVVGVFSDVGRLNPTMERVLNLIPSTKGEKRIEQLNIDALLPEEKTFYRYQGSFTIPPCTERVEWIIFKTPIEMSTQQFRSFSEKFPQANARPLQPINKRKIYTTP
ncbi:carbonic anhydrase [Cytobacillus sp. FJAT-54145]|uniref:Carbonic anhydrase n=1 Tax=Cytobacillus spartinae TaxID=3299023 RepID=A0ABW6K749_9BACI